MFITLAVLASPSNAGSIHDAASEGDLEQIRSLVDSGVDVNSPDPSGSPLQWALFANQTEAVELLLSYGADPNIQGSLGTPLQMAIQYQNVRAVERLLNYGADPNSGDSSTALISAIQSGNHEIFEVLLEAGADPVSPAGDGTTPLHVAAEQGDLEFAQRLLELGADVNAADSYNQPPVHLAVKYKHHDLADLLVEQGAGAAEVPEISEMLATASLVSGEELHEEHCVFCHIGKRTDNINPPLWDVVNRKKAGIVEFKKYSPAFRKLEGVWTYEELNKFIAHPAGYIPGTEMTFPGISDTRSRADLILFLRSLSDNPEPLP